MDIDKLPSFAEVRELAAYLHGDIDKWGKFIEENKFYNIYKN